MFWIVSNYTLWAMEKTNFCILLFVGFFASFCNSQDYRYDDYNYDNYDEYDYNNQNPEDYTDDYSEDFYYDQNLLAPPIPPPPPPIPPQPIPPPPPPTTPPMGKITFFLFEKFNACK